MALPHDRRPDGTGHAIIAPAPTIVPLFFSPDVRPRPRSAPRLTLLFLGAILARGRRTVTSWIRAAGLSGEYRQCYTTVAAAGTRTDLAA